MIRTAPAVLACALLLASASARAADTARYDAKPGSTVRISGTSTLHDWIMDGKIITGFFEVPAAAVFDQSQTELGGVSGGKLAAHAEVSIPVRSVKSEHQGMDEVMQEAMNEKTHPKIQYHLLEMTPKEPHTTGTPFQFDAKGELIINGVTNAISMPVTIQSADKTKLTVAGAIPIKMTDYKVKPPAPSIGLGLITTGDEVKITFSWVVVLSDKPAAGK